MRKLLLFVLPIFFSVFGGCKSEKSYKSDALKISDDILKITTISEQVCSIYSLVWQSAIQKDGTYTTPSSPYYRKDFSEAIAVVQEDKNIVAAIDSLKFWENKIESKIGEVNKYPDNLSQLKNELIESYSTAKNYSRLAQEPKGSLVTFNQEVNSLSAKSKELHDKVKILAK